MYSGKDEGGVAKYDARIMYAIPTPGLAEVEPSMSWNPSVVAGIGVVADPAVLYNDMHSYLASSGEPLVLPLCGWADMLRVLHASYVQCFHTYQGSCLMLL